MLSTVNSFQQSTFIRFLIIFNLTYLLTFTACAQRLRVPAVHSNMEVKKGKVVVNYQGQDAEEIDEPDVLTLERMKGNPAATETGILLDFGIPTFSGSIFYGFIPYDDSKHPLPVYRNAAAIQGGKTHITIKDNMGGRYDMIGWEKSGQGTIGYRVLDSLGQVIYDGKVSFKGTGPFEIDATIVEGPFVNLLSDEGATISFTTHTALKAELNVDGKSFKSDKSGTQHEIAVTGLEANKSYEYTIAAGDNTQTFSFTTAPKAGSRTAFTFCYASDSRSGAGGGERDIHGANSYIMKKIMALATLKDAKFMQFSGDMINGYLTNRGEMDLQYANWKRAIEPFAHYFPVYVSMGNHEAFLKRCYLNDRPVFQVDRFPYETESAEAVFGSNFVLPLNGPQSEDGASYDPNPKKMDFPSYQENVFYYTYDNIAVVVLNSDYWYAPNHPAIPITGGGLHGYFMDQQIAWLAETIEKLENDPNIDHVFTTQHTPIFPNGGHTQDDMWYKGNNQIRPYVAGKPLEKGILERRDQYLDIIINKSTKVRAVFTGDEHNYAKTRISAETNIYPEGYLGEKLDISRTIYQINNGAAGAPYYAQEETPWTPHVSGFSTQNALVFIHVNGEKVSMEVLNPDTLEKVDSLELN